MPVHSGGGDRVIAEGGAVIARETRFLLQTPPPGAWIGQVLPRGNARTSSADRVLDLYLNYGGVVYGRCRRMLRDATAAEDITQETFLRVHRAERSIPGPEAVLPWLYRIASNLCLNAIRDGRARPQLFEEPPDRAGGCLEEWLANRNLVARLIARVSPKVQVTAWMFYIDAMGQGEIAEVLGISRRSVAKRLAQFKSRSQQFLRAEGL
jgi:RNA polymerase sigma-70 factor, ECF subfamily